MVACSTCAGVGDDGNDQNYDSDLTASRSGARAPSNRGGTNWLPMRRIHLDRRPLYGYGKISSADWS
jgi:hypothetical protein